MPLRLLPMWPSPMNPHVASRQRQLVEKARLAGDKLSGGKRIEESARGRQSVSLASCEVGILDGH